jgi:Tfp pilus assembly protein PilF
MKAWNRLAGAACALSIVASACGGSDAPAAPAGDARATAGDATLNLLVAVQGDVKVKREGWSEYARALFGIPVRSGDLLKLDSGSQARVACSDLTVVEVPGGVSGAPCKVSQPVLVYKGAQVNATRAMPSSDYPVIITPRKTRLLNPRPLLRWTPVAGAEAYKVVVRGPDVEWSAETGQTEMAYPESAPQLAPGSAYKLSVTTGDRASDEEGTPGLGFTILSADEAQAVRDAEARVKALGLDDAPTRLLIASLYANRELTAEAIEQLEALSNGSQEPAVMRLLGDLYLRIGLNYLAEEHYLKALEASRQADDVEGEAAAHHVLGQLYEAMGNREAAVEHLQEAIALYEKLGDAATVKNIRERLAQIQGA